MGLVGRLKERVARVKGDLAHLARIARGGRAPTSISRARQETERRGQTVAVRRVRVEDVIRETEDAVTLVLADRAGGAIRFVPGQFFTVLVRLDGETVRRAYSASRLSEDPSRLYLTMKRIAGGRVSSHLNERIAIGDELELLGPSGSFTVTPGRAQRVLVAGGSGITPMMAIAEWSLTHESETQVTLLYGNRRERDIIFRARLDELAARHAGRLTVTHVLAEPGEGWTGERGMLDRETVARLAAALPIDAEYFLCGPEPMMVAAREALTARGVRAIKEEKFTQPHLRVEADVPAVARRVEMRKGGVASLVVAAPGQTLLEAGLAAGIPMDYSCTMGGCGACKVKLTAGRVVMEEPNCLSPGERAANEVLACIGRPASDDVRIVL
jgi:ring-1,2-phenylacetyl-CoA epoxidase subunit PaaE